LAPAAIAATALSFDEVAKHGFEFFDS